MGVGAEVYGNCSSCHGGSGEGGVGRQLADGEVNETFPHIEDQLRFVYFGTEQYNLAGVTGYGDPDREGGAHLVGQVGVMPQWGSSAGGDLTDAEILAVVCHERYSFNGPDPADEAVVEEYELWCSEESPMYAALEAGTALADLDTAGITDLEGAAVRDHRHRRRSRRGQPDPRGVSTMRCLTAVACRYRAPPPTDIASTAVVIDETATADLSGHMPHAGDIVTEVLIVGGGPAGAAAGYWLARHGHDVTVIERKTFPREKTCGDGLTPRAVHQLDEMGLGRWLERFHRYHGLRATGMGRELELEWPAHPVYPSHGYVVRRRDLDAMVADNAVAAGAKLLEGHEAIHPIVDRGFVRGSTVARQDGSSVDIRAEFTIVADGANSRFGRALGTSRTREWPYGTAIRTYWQSSRHADPWIESALDVKDRNGNPMPGYGWIFPVGDGTVNIGVGLLSTFRDFKSVNTTHLLDAYARQIADRWEIDPDTPECRPTSGRIPMGGSVGPKAGPTYLVVGDAAGQRQPVQRRGHRLCLRDGADGRRRRPRGAQRGRRLGAAALPEAARRRLRPVLQGRPPVRQGDRPSGVDARVDPRRDAQPHVDGVGAADHGQPPAPRRARPRRGRLQGRCGDRPRRPRRLNRQPMGVS